MEALASNI